MEICKEKDIIKKYSKVYFIIQLYIIINVIFYYGPVHNSVFAQMLTTRRRNM
jgi:hypothetical protein